jgi:hypothetical protein
MVMAAVPMAAVVLAVKVNIVVLVPGFGLNAALTPLGKPEAEKVTLPLKPFAGVMVMMLVPLAPWKTLSVTGAAEST